MVTSLRLMQSTRKSNDFPSPVDQVGAELTAISLGSGCDPLTPDDIAEVIVFTASRRQNVVIADTLIFPNHQVCEAPTE